VSGPVPYYRLRPGPAGRHDNWGLAAHLAGGLLKHEHQRVFLYVGCQERYRLTGRINHVTPHAYQRTFRSHAAA
jgi:hypothetical protein